MAELANKEKETVKIVGKREMPHYVSPGVVETIVEVTYRTPAGYEGRVTIPKKELTAERVKEEIKKSLKPVTEAIPEEITL